MLTSIFILVALDLQTQSLFHPTCRIVMTGNYPEKGVILRVLELEEFLSRAVPNWERDFFELETNRIVQQWGNMAKCMDHLWSSTFKSRRSFSQRHQ